MESDDWEWVAISGSDEIDEEDLEGLDYVEQQRSLARAWRWELQPEFVGIPDRRPKAIFGVDEPERKNRAVSPEEERQCRKLRVDFDSRKA